MDIDITHLVLVSGVEIIHAAANELVDLEGHHVHLLELRMQEVDGLPILL